MTDTCGAVGCENTPDYSYTAHFAQASDITQNQNQATYTVCSEHRASGLVEITERIARTVNGENRALTSFRIEENPNHE